MSVENIMKIAIEWPLVIPDLRPGADACGDRLYTLPGAQPDESDFHTTLKETDTFLQASTDPNVYHAKLGQP
jgi:hypothetical protein